MGEAEIGQLGRMGKVGGRGRGRGQLRNLRNLDNDFILVSSFSSQGFSPSVTTQFLTDEEEHKLLSQSLLRISQMCITSTHLIALALSHNITPHSFH
jgi:hypothetical protein